MLTAAYIALLLGGGVLLFWIVVRLAVLDHALHDRFGQYQGEVDLLGYIGLALVLLSAGFVAIGYIAGAGAYQ
jgi:hypothetical protein